MIKRMINEIQRALDNELYVLALLGALTMIGACSNAEYPQYKDNEKYKMWYDTFIAKYKYPENISFKNEDGVELPRLTGELVYQLRCSMVHTNDTDINNSKITNEREKLTKFVLLVEPCNSFDIYVSIPSVSYQKDDNGNIQVVDRCFELNILDFCKTACIYCGEYYEKSPNKFVFSYNIELI